MAPLFDYQGFEASGKAARGMVEAENAKAGRQKLRKQGVLVTQLSEKVAGTSSQTGKSSVPFSGLFGGGVSVADMSMMTRQLASLVKANIPLVESLNALVEQTDNPTLKVTLAAVRQDVTEGLSFGKASGKHPKVFDHIFVNMIEAGEASGALSLVLMRLADFKESQMRLRNKVSSAMTYPALMMSFSILMVLGIFTFLIPKLTEVFKDSNKPLPQITVVMIGISDFLVNYWYLLAAGFFFGASSFLKYIRSEKGKPWWDAKTLQFPIFGPLLRLIAVTRFASTLSTLLGSGVPILGALAISQRLVGNTLIADAIGNARANITEGQSIAEPLKRSGQFPPLVIHMIAIGERTGELPGMLQNIANTYEDQVNSKVQGLTALLEPVMIIFMGVMILIIVVSIFVPLMEMSNVN